MSRAAAPSGGRIDRRAIEASVNFVGPMTERPYVDVNDASRNRLDLVSHTVQIHDARPLVGQLSLEKEGFVLVKHPLPAVDFHNPEDIARRYLPMVQDLVQSVTGAARVITSDGPVVRFSSPKLQTSTTAYPATFVHTDYTEGSARVHMATSYDRALPESAGRADTRTLMRQSVSAPAGDRPKYPHVAAVQTWRVFSPPPHDKPLAICAADSVFVEDIVEYDFTVGDFEGVTFQANLYRHNQGQRWYSFPDMTPDEVLIFVGFDFQHQDTCRVLHTSFEDPNCPEGVDGRCSIEARTFAFFDE